jgi:hypothetical protein
MSKVMLPRLGAACGIVFPIAMFVASGDGGHFAPWRAVAASWAIVVALPFLAYLYCLLRSAVGDDRRACRRRIGRPPQTHEPRARPRDPP